MPLISVTHKTGNLYLVPKAKLIEMFFTANNIPLNTLKNFYYDATADALVFELNDIVATENVNYSSSDLTTP